MIRVAQIEDAEAITDIKIKGWQHAYKGIIDQTFLNNLDNNYQKDILKVQERIGDLNSNSSTYVYQDDEIGKVLGFVCFGEIREQIDVKIDCELYAIYINLEFKDKGIGKQLLNNTKNIFKEKGYKNMLIWCLKDNYNAIKFYEKMGGVKFVEKMLQIGEQELVEV